MTTLLNFFKRFRQDESGAVTVDWVVLTVGMITLGSLLYPFLSDGVTSGGTKMKNEMSK